MAPAAAPYGRLNAMAESAACPPAPGETASVRQGCGEEMRMATIPTQGDVQQMIAGMIAQLTGTPADQVDLGGGRVLMLDKPSAGYNWSFPETRVKARFRPFVHRAVSMVRDQHPILE